MVYEVGILSGDHFFYQLWFRAFLEAHDAYRLDSNVTWEQINDWLKPHNAKRVDDENSYALEFNSEKDYLMFILRWS